MSYIFSEAGGKKPKLWCTFLKKPGKYFSQMEIQYFCSNAFHQITQTSGKRIEVAETLGGQQLAHDSVRQEKLCVIPKTI